MKVAAVLLSILSAATAFAPVTRTARADMSLAARSKALPFLEQPTKLDGSMAGDAGFDPLGLSSIEGFGADLYWMREAELKHARVAMLAVTGTLFVETCGGLPGWPEAKGADQMDVFWAVWEDKPTAIVASLVFFTMFEVVSGFATTKGRESGLREPGDFKFNPLNFQDTMEMRTKELKNGRLAMLAAAGIIVQGLTTGHGAIENLVTGK